MPGLLAVFDPLARHDLGQRYGRQERAVRNAPHYLAERFEAPDGRVAIGRVDLGIFNPGRQPLIGANGRYALVMQGEFYDREPALANLARRGVPLAGREDVHLLLGTILADGLRGVERLNGSYFFLLWDEHEGTLTVGGDRYANRPHYYHFHEGRCYLAPEVKGILAARGEAPAASLPGIASFLALEHPMGDLTLFDGIRAFPGGTFLELSAQGARWHSYWTPRYTAAPETSTRPEAGWLAHTTELFRQALRRATEQGDFCLPLSGGTDSRMIAAFSATRDYPTFTFGAEGSEDVVYARMVAATLGLRHQVFGLAPDYLSRHADAMLQRGEGMVSLFHAHDLDVLQHVTGLAPVMVYGMTAEYFRTEVLEYVLAQQPRSFLHRLSLFARHALEGQRPRPHFADEQAFVDHVLGYYWNVITPELARELLAPELAAAMQTQLREQFLGFFAGVDAADPLDRVATFNVSIRQRRFSQAGVKLGNPVAEYRKPFDDYDLIDHVLTLPAATRRKVQTRVLCHAAPALAALPRTGTGIPLDASYARRGWALATKEMRRMLRPERMQSFANPHQLLRGPSRAFFENLLLDPGTLNNGYFNAEGVRALVQQHMAGRTNAASALCALATLELWRRMYASASLSNSLAA